MMGERTPYWIFNLSTVFFSKKNSENIFFARKKRDNTNFLPKKRVFFKSTSWILNFRAAPGIHVLVLRHFPVPRVPHPCITKNALFQPCVVNPGVMSFEFMITECSRILLWYVLERGVFMN